MNIPNINWKEKETMFEPEKWTWLEVVTDEFIIPLGFPTEEDVETLYIICGGIFGVSRGEYATSIGSITSRLFVLYGNVFSPSLLNIEFLRVNELSGGGKVFIDVTKNIVRESKLNKIL